MVGRPLRRGVLYLYPVGHVKNAGVWREESPVNDRNVLQHNVLIPCPENAAIHVKVGLLFLLKFSYWLGSFIFPAMPFGLILPIITNYL